MNREVFRGVSGHVGCGFPRAAVGFVSATCVAVLLGTAGCAAAPTPQCRTAADCDDRDGNTVDTCDSGVCRNTASPTPPRGVPCREPCDVGFVCDRTSGTCVRNAQPIGCPQLPCGAGFVCNVGTGECILEVRNEPPVADAGAYQDVKSGAGVTLDGRQSFDPEGSLLSYQWVQLSGVAVVLDGATSATPTFVAPPVIQPAELEFALTVSDGAGSSPPSSVTVTVTRSPLCAEPLAFSSQSFSSGGWYPIGVAIADLDLDGVADLVVGNPSYRNTEDPSETNVSVLHGTGAGRLDPPRGYYSGFQSDRVAVGDLDRDGYPDVVTTNFGDGTVGILFGTATGIFDGTRSTTIQVGGNPRGVALADLNQDGLLDILVANAPFGKVAVLLNSEGATFATARTIEAISGGDGPDSIAIADFDRDGCLDAAVTLAGASSTSISVFLGFCDGTFSPRTEIEAGVDPAGIAAGDFDFDGNTDLAVGNYRSGTVSVLFGDGLGTFPTKDEPEVGSWAAGVAAADIDGDGIDDIVVASEYSGTVTILLSNSNGSFRSARYSAGMSPSRVAVGDLDNDGDLDIAVTNYLQAGTVTVLLNRCIP